MTFARTLTALAAATLLILPLGCADNSGRYGLGETTEGEQKSKQIQFTELQEFAEQAATNLLADLAEIPELGKQTHSAPEIEGETPKPVIYIGDLVNETDIVSTRDFEILARKITGTLINSRVGREQIRFIEKRARVDAIAATENVNRDAPDLDAKMTYSLTGNFYRTGRGDTQYYYLDFSLIRLHDAQIVFRDDYESKRVASK
ncbi:hypothetical protein [Mucisphaera calidilacus]|uniref:Penicillin-binding protein activator LpoB n=1 Tax=Mucisphaera calidilacus TaxID=2527982 RepID=A0A518BTD8_9BACT|nr:hypothetical protein [Mucisphaera calidilacus]QDU70241.1 hypothetical protein Pan265_00630 [Mucisphaera calidilacus]